MRPRPRIVPTVASALLVLTVSACGTDAVRSASAVAGPTHPPLGPFDAALVGDLRTEPDITYTEEVDCGGTPCHVPGDVLAPSDGSGHPTVVLLGGGATPFERRRYQEDLPIELAKGGAVVFLMSYRSATTGSYDSESASDSACAVRFARVNAATYGGDPDRVVVIGHSMGGFLGLNLAVQPETDAVGCLADGSARPDGVIGLGAPRPRPLVPPEDVPPIWLLAGSEDAAALGVAERLADQGYDVEGYELAGVTHDGITDPAAAPQIVDIILGALGSL